MQHGEHRNQGLTCVTSLEILLPALTGTGKVTEFLVQRPRKQLEKEKELQNRERNMRMIYSKAPTQFSTRR